MTITDIEESFLFTGVRFPLFENSTAKDFMNLRRGYPLSITQPVWLNLRAIVSETVDECYNPKTSIILFNN